MRPRPSRPTTRSTSASPAEAQRAIRARCSRPVSRGDRAGASIRLPTRRGRAPPADRGSRPSSRTWPASAASSPRATRRAVVLPAPLGPISPYSSPSPTRRSSPASTRVRPKRRYTPSSSTAAVAASRFTGAPPWGSPDPSVADSLGHPLWGSPDPSVAELIADALNQNTGAGRDGRAWSGDPAARYNLAMTGIRAPAARTRAREEAVLAALAAGVVGPAVDPAVPGQMLGILDGTANRGDRERLLAVLRALDTRAGALALTGRPGP